MKRSTERRTASVLTVATLGLLIASPSHAYLDTGSKRCTVIGLH